MKLGFVGLGAMGAPMLGHLVAAGHRVSIWARRAEAAAPLLAEGRIGWCESPAALAAESEIVCSIVTASEDVEALALGERGLIHGMAPGCLHLDMSTIAPGSARALARHYGERGIGWVDAPVSGGAAGARARRLVFMAGALPADFERVIPLFQAMGHQWVHVGPPGCGQIAKCCNQTVMVNAIAACAEAMQLAAAHGVDPAAVRRALLGGSAASRALDVMGQRMLTRDYANGVQARLHHKDYAIVMAEAHRLGAPLPVSAAVGQLLNALMALGGARRDTAALLEVLETLRKNEEKPC